MNEREPGGVLESSGGTLMFGYSLRHNSQTPRAECWSAMSGLDAKPGPGSQT